MIFIGNETLSENGITPKNSYLKNDYPDPQADEVAVCEEWIKQFGRRIKNYNPEAYSYTLKSKVEQWRSKYVTNGAFILAALNLGYQYKICGKEGPNATFNMKLFLPEDKWKRTRAINLSRWLFRQKESDNLICDLARDAIKDPTWPRRAKLFIEFWFYLQSKGAPKERLDTLIETWTACYNTPPPFPNNKMQGNCDAFYNEECDILKYGEPYKELSGDKTYIYVLYEHETDNDILHVRYVGQTQKPAIRLKQHINCPGNIKKVIWTGKLLEKGLFPIMGIIDIVDKNQSALIEEAYILAFFEHERNLNMNKPIEEILYNISLAQNYIKIYNDSNCCYPLF